MSAARPTDRVTLVMPAWAKAADAEDFEIDCWEELARKQLAADPETWENLEEGHILAVEDRESIKQPWPGNRRFVVILDDERVILFDEHGAAFHDEDDSPDGLVLFSTFERQFAANNGDYFRIPPESSLCNFTTTLPDFAAAYGAEVEAAELEQQIGMLPPGSPARETTARELAAAPAPAADIRSPLASVGARVLMAGVGAVVFAHTSKWVCVAYDNFDWCVWSHADFAKAATKEVKPAAGAVEGVVRHPNPKVTKIEGFLIGKQSEAGPNAWEWFDRYEPRPATNDANKWSEPRLPSALKAGQQVACTGKVLASGEGPVTLIALAQAREKPLPREPKDGKVPKPELRRYAVVAVAGQLALAQLLSAEDGYVTPTSPSVSMPDAELQQLQLQVSAFLGPLNVSALKSRFSRAQLAASLEPPEPRRSQRTASAASASSTSAPSEAASTANTSTTTACPVLPFDLYRVSERKLHGFSLAQLHALCASRQLAVLPNADKTALVKVLKTFRDREGRHRRSSITPLETPTPTVDGSQGGSDDGQEQGWKPRKPKADGVRRHKGKRKRARPPTPSPSSSRSASPCSRSASPLSPPRHPRRRKQHVDGTPNSISSMSTPPDVRKARIELAAAEAARIARMQETVNRYERKQHEKKKKHHRKERRQ